MGRPLLRRLAAAPVALLVVCTTVFLAVRLAPGSPATDLAAAGADGQSTAEIAGNAARVEATLGLDRPWPEQYLGFLRDLAHLDLGVSIHGGNDVTTLVGQALPATIELAVAAMLIAAVTGVGAGVLAALRRDTWLDTAGRVAGTVAYSLPWFAPGVLAIVVFGVWLDRLPVIGRLPHELGYRPSTGFVPVDAVVQDRPELVAPWAEHLILPAVTLALSPAGFLIRVVRAAVLDVLGEDFVRTARGKGLRRGQVLCRHVLRAASPPVVTVLGLHFGTLLGGSVVTETVFSYPGVGRLLVNAIMQRDYPVVQAAALAVAVLFVLVNVVVDALCLILDPRLRKV
ncbi:ABC transporter permease [Actinoplanes sp. NPDC026670]|uniref:ABC transporter permease n=1 Tax=Actinoplanes sp. NPDC026670 TaxID=3154700 RepID=UPI0033C771F0